MPTKRSIDKQGVIMGDAVVTGMGARRSYSGTRVLLVLLAILFVDLMGGRALAVSPSVIEETGTAFGRSVWRYQDIRDADFKYEGGYARFDDTLTLTYAEPHGGYDTMGSKCKVCHAAHRSEGSYDLMRADSQSDACGYCHVGGSAHSTSTVYDGNAQGMSTPVGHTIGASPLIPDSSVETTLESLEISSVDASGNVTTQTVQVRSADTARNKIFRLRRSHTQSQPGDLTAGYQRVGPTSLSCMSCHQPHNASEEAWRPPVLGNESSPTAGYKLLRANPSGSVWGPDDLPYGNGGPATVSYTRDGMKVYQQYTDFSTTGLVNKDNAIKVPETTLAAGTTYGYSKTIWSSPPWPYESTASPGPARDPGTVTQYALSAWCADCHNLAIGNFKNGEVADVNLPAHETSRTHPSPMTGANNGPGQCYTCHRADLSPEPPTASYDNDPAALACEKCHYGTGAYADDPKRTTSDFPHSAESSGTKMLGPWTVDASGSVEATAISESNIRAVCLRCHQAGAKTHG